MSTHRSGGALAIMLISLGVLALLAVVGWFSCGYTGCPDIEEIRGFMPDEASVVVDRDGEEVSKLFRVNRVVVPVEGLPEHVPQAFIAIEDRRFYSHGGIDYQRATGAILQTIRSKVGLGGQVEGGSTLTMQVARNVFPDRLPVGRRTIARKIGEWRVARQLEDRYTKDEILELYLNQIYFGNGAWGIEAAAREYFGKPASELTLTEATLLAAVPQMPSRVNPRDDMEAARARQATVLNRMVEQGMISPSDAENARADKVALARTQLDAEGVAPYFVEHVRQILEQQLGQALYTEGFTIRTTLDLDIQRVTEAQLERQLANIESGVHGAYRHATHAGTVASEDNGGASGRETPYIQGAAVFMEVTSGEVLALVGGRDFKDSKFNRATQARRQPGSAFKPFVYAAAIAAGYPATLLLEDAPYRLERDGRVWEPRNYDGTYAGEIPMREALVRSKNVATIRLADRVGLSRVIDTAKRMGISGDIPNYPSIAIGAAEVTLLELVAAYGAFASLGRRSEPRFVLSVEDRSGATVWQGSPSRAQVIESDVAFVVNTMLQDVVSRGTGTAVRGVGYQEPAGGKTGTTNEASDVWFVGFTPKIVGGVWMGMDDPRRIVRGATGGRLAAPVWGRIMRQFDSGGGGWTPPPGVERRQVDPDGNVLAADCPTYGDTSEEWFLRGRAPVVGGCPGDWYGYGSDSLGYGTVGWDTIRSGPEDEDDEAWWERLRRRFLEDEEARADTLGERRRRPAADTIILDTVRSPRPRPDVPVRPRPTPRDTARPDLRPERPDTLPRPRPDPLDSRPDPEPEPPDTVSLGEPVGPPAGR